MLRPVAQAGEHQLVIRGAVVHDGRGSPGRELDVACSGPMITAVGDVSGRGAEEIDGRGLHLAPGFIDPHTHLDANLFWDPDLTPSSSYGVTTVVLANCGYGLAPVDDTTRDYVAETMSFVEQIPREALERGVPWDWSTLPEYFTRLGHTSSLLNFAVLAGHVPIRAAAMGPAAAREREATADELVAMAALLREALALGALGFSTDQVEANVGAGGAKLPGQVCSPHEMLAFARTLHDGPGPGLFTMAHRALLSDRDDRMADLAWHREIAAASGRPVVVGPVFELWNDRGGAVAVIEAATRADTTSAGAPRRDGRVVPQISTRPFELWTRLDEPGVLVRCLPTLNRAVRAGSVRDVAMDPEFRLALRSEGAQIRPLPIFSGRWEHVRVRYSPSRPEWFGATVADLAATARSAPTDLLLDLAIADAFETQVAVAMANGDDDAIAHQLRTPGAMIGASDAGAHVMSNTDSCYAVWTLQHWVRERAVLSLEGAIRMLTGDQADLLGLHDRGRIAPGLAADMVLFDPDTVATTGVRYVADQPAGGKRLVTDATGIALSVVNGKVATRDGVPAGIRSGLFLTGGGST